MFVKEENCNTTVLYPNDFLQWDQSSQYISQQLNETVFLFHIHDGSLWMYTIYHNGHIVDQFCPIPDYWDDDLSRDEIEKWRGDARVVNKYVPYVSLSNIQNYLIRWDLDIEDEIKAYPYDEYSLEDRQLLDFTKALRLPFPIDDNAKPLGTTYKMWTALSSADEQSNINKNERIESNRLLLLHFNQFSQI